MTDPNLINAIEKISSSIAGLGIVLAMLLFAIVLALWTHSKK